jgi:hypothetical protein
MVKRYIRMKSAIWIPVKLSYIVDNVNEVTDLVRRESWRSV